METQRPSKREYFLSMLTLVSSRSTCIRRAVGAIITDIDGHILSTGYNGPPKNVVHCIDVECQGAHDTPGNTDNCQAVHAEINAVLQCLDLKRAHTLYCSNLPCFSCSKMLLNTNISVIIAKEDYADHRGLEMFLDQGLFIEVAGKAFGLEDNDEPIL